MGGCCSVPLNDFAPITPINEKLMDNNDQEPLVSGSVERIEDVPDAIDVSMSPERLPPSHVMDVPTSFPVAVRGEAGDAFSLLLCGAGESGKTTLTRQMKLRFLPDAMDDAERRSYVPTIRGNMIEAIQILLGHCERIGIVFDDDLHSAISRVQVLNAFLAPLTPEVWEDLVTLWESAPVKAAFAARDQTILPDNMDYFFARLDAIQGEDYVPTDDDVLRMRIRSVGIDSVTFRSEGALVRFYDVGGQRAERGKWSSVPEIDGIVFVASFADFTKPCFEDPAVLRINDALDLFGSVLAQPFAASIPVFFVANKVDVFAERIAASQTVFVTAFPEFSGDAGNVDACAEYLIGRFLERAGPARADRPVQVLRSNALDAESVARNVARICEFVRLNYFEA